ncbi:MFS transporter [Kordiimonas sp.]|uniref:MFS transporter n=1 Tax=Kordiimonas sp. TaxID=1970157 RepID=UPI003A92A6A8
MPILFLVIFVVMGSFAMLLPSIMFVLKNLGANEAWATPILASYSFAQFLTGPYWGKVSDRWGRKPVLICGLILAACAYGFIAVWADSVLHMHMSLVLAGACAGNSAVLYAAVTDITGREGRAKGMGIMGAGVGLAFTIGPAIGAMLSGVSAEAADITAPATVSALACLAGACIVVIWFKETLQRESDGAPETHAGRIAAFLKVSAKPALMQLAVAMCFFTLALSMMEAIMSYLMNARLGWGPKDLGIMFSYFGVILIVVQGGLVGRLARRFGEERLALAGVSMMGVGLAVIALSMSTAGVFVGLGFISAGTGIYNTSVLAVGSYHSGKLGRGLTMGVFQSMQALGRSVGPLIVGLLYVAQHELPLFVGCAVMVVLFAWLLVIFRRLQVGVAARDTMLTSQSDAQSS